VTKAPRMTSSPVACTACGLCPQTVLRTLKQLTAKMIGACNGLRRLEPVLVACGLDRVGGPGAGVLVAPDPPGALAPPVPSPLATGAASASTAAAVARLPRMWRGEIIEKMGAGPSRR
jgi:hypothetical protein